MFIIAGFEIAGIKFKRNCKDLHDTYTTCAQAYTHIHSYSLTYTFEDTRIHAHTYAIHILM